LVEDGSTLPSPKIIFLTLPTHNLVPVDQMEGIDVHASNQAVSECFCGVGNLQ
jgi:hypothetical protein